MSLLLGCMVVVCLAVSLVMLAGLVGEQTLLVRIFVALFPGAAAVAGSVALWRTDLPRRLDISGTGQVRISGKLLATSDDAATPNASANTTRLCKILTGSLLIPSLLVLRLQQDAGSVITLAIFRDSVSPEAFRRLSVACHWVAAQHHRASEKLL